MKFKFGLLVTIIIPFIIIFAFYSFAPATNRTDKQQTSNNDNNFRYIQNDSYGFNERLNYKVKYSFITAGEGYFQIMPNPVYVNQRQCYDVRFQVNSLKSLEWIYKVKDRYTTILDVAGIFPWQFEQNIREGKYTRDYKATFDQSNHIAFANKKNHKVKPYIHDVVSAFYFVRTLKLGSMRKDTVFYLQNFFDDTTFTLGVKIVGKQTVEVEAGKFKCTVIEPLVVQGGLFKSEGNVLIWLTDDERKIPVKVATKILIGFVSAELVSYSGIRGQIKAKIE